VDGRRIVWLELDDHPHRKIHGIGALSVLSLGRVVGG
jgi:hypothetical protein